MPRKVTPLTDIKIRKSKPGEKSYTLTDGGGLELHVRQNGTKAWRFRYYRPDGRRNMIGLGKYPDVSLNKARQEAARLRGLLDQGIDPAEQRMQEREAQRARARENSPKFNPPFSQVFSEWHALHSERWSDTNARKMLIRGEKHLVANIGDVPVRALTKEHFFEILERIDKAGHAETRNRVKQMAQQVMDYAMAKGYRPDNPVASINNKAFRPPKSKSRPHTHDPKMLQAILHKFEAYRGDASVRAVLRILPHLPLRAQELAGLKWSEVDMKARMLRLPGERMKKDRPFKCPISDAVYAILSEQYEAFGALSEYVFPSPRTMARPISAESLGNAIRRMGFKGVQSAHGFRHTMATLLNEMGYDRQLVRIQLSHRLENETEAAYNKAEYMTQRRQMMDEWSRWLESLKAAPASELHRFAVAEPADGYEEDST